MFESFFVSTEEALEAGLTHKAKLYGVSVFVANPNKADIGVACKFQPFILWTSFIDFLMGLCLLFVTSDKEFVLPLRDLKLIKEI